MGSIKKDLTAMGASKNITIKRKANQIKDTTKRRIKDSATNQDMKNIIRVIKSMARNLVSLAIVNILQGVMGEDMTAAVTINTKNLEKSNLFRQIFIY